MKYTGGSIVFHDWMDVNTFANSEMIRHKENPDRVNTKSDYEKKESY